MLIFYLKCFFFLEMFVWDMIRLVVIMRVGVLIVLYVVRIIFLGVVKLFFLVRFVVGVGGVVVWFMVYMLYVINKVLLF